MALRGDFPTLKPKTFDYHSIISSILVTLTAVWFKFLGYEYNLDLLAGISVKCKFIIIANIFLHCLNLLLGLKFLRYAIKNISGGKHTRIDSKSIIRTI